MENPDFYYSGGLDAESRARLQGTINTDILDLNVALRTETHAPEILPFQTELVESVLEALKNQKNFIDQKIDQSTHRSIFTVNLYEMDILRVKFSLTKYLRTRILKIEDQSEAIVSDLELFDRLSYAEKEFLGKLTEMNKTYLEDTIYRRLEPETAETFQRAEDIARHCAPRENEFVFSRALRDCSGVRVGRGTVENYRTGDIQIVRYSAIRDNIIDGSMELI